MCLIKGAFVGEKNLDVNKMHGTTIKKGYTVYVYLYIYTNLYMVSRKAQCSVWVLCSDMVVQSETLPCLVIHPFTSAILCYFVPVTSV